jgi:hypothetical protein
MGKWVAAGLLATNKDKWWSEKASRVDDPIKEVRPVFTNKALSLQLNR